LFEEDKVMNRIFRTLLLSALVLTLGSMATSAATAPNGGDMAVSFNAGLVNAFDDTFDDVENVFTGTFEYYTSPRVSWRGLVGTTSFDGDLPNAGERVKVDATFLTANVVYNWEGNRVHPFVTGGIGAYQKDASPRGSSVAATINRFDETTFGVNGGGGLDWYLGSNWAIKFEGVLHALTGENPKAIAVGTAGFKFWF
jgi:hypothetical protein